MKKKIQYKSSKKLIFLMKNGKSVNIPMYNIFFHFANNTIRLTDFSFLQSISNIISEGGGIGL